MRSVSSLLTPRTSRAIGRLSLLALGTGMMAACSSGIVSLSEPVFTGSTANQQQILSGQANAYAQTAPAYQPAPSYQTASSAPVQSRDLPPPSGSAYSSAYASTPSYQQQASYTPPSQPQSAYRPAEIQSAQPGAASGPQPYTPPSAAAQPQQMASAPAMPQPRGMPPTTLGEQAQQIEPRPAPVQVASINPQSMTGASSQGMPAGAPQAAAPRPTNTQTAAIAVQPEAAQRAAEAANPPAAAPQAQSGDAFRWPVRGRIISGFGKKPNGERNDGINLAVPEGTPVKAAEDGTVIYSGNELKSYGNLVLVRHDNGWVSAYAHNSDLQVKRGDQVRRGQVVALSGMSGGVTTPQVHFELRKDATPVDPVGRLTDA